MGQSSRMLVPAAALAVPAAAITVMASAATPSTRRLICDHLTASRIAGAVGLLAIVLAGVWLDLGPVAAAGGVLSGAAVWTLKPLRRRWGHPLPRCPDWEWERFETAFRAYAARVDRRRRGSHSDG